MTNTTPNNTVARIQKLLVRSKDNTGATTQNEVEQALAMAQRLAVEHGIDLAVVAQTGPAALEKIEKAEMSCGQRFSVCQRFINTMLENYFNVQVLTHGSRYGGRRVILIGKTSDIQIAEYVQGFLNHEYMRLWHRAKIQHRLPLKDRHSYIYGLHRGLSVKLADAKRNAEKDRFDMLALERGAAFKDQVADSYALAVVSEEDRLKDAVKVFFPRVTYSAPKRNFIRSHNTMGLGVEAGRNININPGLTGGTVQKRLN